MVPQGIADKIGHRMDLEFAHEICAVSVGGFGADTENQRGFPAVFALGDQLQKFQLPGRKRFFPIARRAGEFHVPSLEFNISSVAQMAKNGR